jgi:hypothetical protein
MRVLLGRGEMAERYVPRGFIGSEQALVLIARTSHPERWRDDLLLGKEREIYERLGSSLNGEFLGDHIKVSLTKTDRESGAVMERICDFEDAAHWLRESLHAGDLVGKYLDENGDWHDIPSNRWGADDGLEALLKGVVVFDEGRHLVSRLILFSTEELMALVTDSANPHNAASRRTIKDKGGRPLEYDWDAVKEYMLALVKRFGVPGKKNRRLPTKNDLVALILEEWARKDIQLSESTLRRYVTKWLGEL